MGGPRKLGEGTSYQRMIVLVAIFEMRQHVWEVVCPEASGGGSGRTSCCWLVWSTGDSNKLQTLHHHPPFHPSISGSSVVAIHYHEVHPTLAIMIYHTIPTLTLGLGISAVSSTLAFTASPSHDAAIRHHIIGNVNRRCPQRSIPTNPLFSTPFDLDMYDPSEDSELDASSNPFQPDEDDVSDLSPLAVPPDTELVLGINKYSHDTTICAADAKTGKVLFAVAKERITRKKHDGGNIAGLVELCLDQLDLDLDSVVKVVMNNHHHRILPFIEQNPDHMEWEEGLGINGGTEDGYSDEYNILTTVEDKIEMSHHLAHAYSAASQCPFNEGMVVVMDGMGETYRTMKRAADLDDVTYVSDFSLCVKIEDIQFVPSDIEEKAKKSYFDWREAESVYTFKKDKARLEMKVRLRYYIATSGISFVARPHVSLSFSNNSTASIQTIHTREYTSVTLQPWLRKHGLSWSRILSFFLTHFWRLECLWQGHGIGSVERARVGRR